MQATKEFCAKYTPQVQAAQEAPKQQDVGQALDEFFQKKKPGTKKVHFLLGKHLQDISLQDLPQEAWPQYAAMDAAATEGARLLAKLVEAGSPITQKLFVCVDLIEFEPSWCKGKVEADHRDEEEQQQEMYQQNKGFQALAGMLGAKTQKKQRHTFPRWQAACGK